MNKMDINEETTDWSSLTYEEKNKLLFYRERNLLDTFLEKGAITQVQHDKSLHDLIVKMGMENVGDDYLSKVVIYGL